MNELTYCVPDISCDHCVHAITNEVGRVAGVTAVDVDLRTKAVAVRGNGLEDAAVRAAIVEAGYEPALS
jgi:copper chaperone CopZ